MRSLATPQPQLLEALSVQSKSSHFRKSWSTKWEKNKWTVSKFPQNKTKTFRILVVLGLSEILKSKSQPTQGNLRVCGNHYALRKEIQKIFLSDPINLASQI